MLANKYILGAGSALIIVIVMMGWGLKRAIAKNGQLQNSVQTLTAANQSWVDKYNQKLDEEKKTQELLIKSQQDVEKFRNNVRVLNSKLSKLERERPDVRQYMETPIPEPVVQFVNGVLAAASGDASRLPKRPSTDSPATDD